MKRLCIVCPGLLPVPAVEGGAVETLVTNFINQNERFHKFEIVLVSKYSKNAKEKSSGYKYTKFIYIKSNKILYKYLEIARCGIQKLTGIDLIWLNRYYAQAAVKLLKYNFDYYLMEGGPATCLKSLTNSAGVEKCYLHLHGHTLYNQNIEKIFGHFVFVSNYCAKEFNIKETMHSQVHTIYNGIQVEKFSEKISQDEFMKLRNKYGWNENDKVILYCGRIIPEKGVQELIKAVLQTGMKLLIAGSSEFKGAAASKYVKKIIQSVKKYGNQIKFSGYVSNSKVSKLYQMADIVALPSLCEDAGPLVAIEAMAAGKPIVTFNSGGIPEYVSSNEALIINKPKAVGKDYKKLLNNSILIQELVEGLTKIAEDSALLSEMGNKGIERAKLFTTEQYYNKMTELFE